MLGVAAGADRRATARSAREVARAMAEGALARSPAPFAVAVTGIAGPGGGTPGKPVGTVWIAIARARRAARARPCCSATGDRAAVRERSVSPPSSCCSAGVEAQSPPRRPDDQGRLGDQRHPRDRPDAAARCLLGEHQDEPLQRLPGIERPVGMPQPLHQPVADVRGVEQMGQRRLARSASRRARRCAPSRPRRAPRAAPAAAACRRRARP